ncbi:MAG TPA: hypothetical protein VMI72_08965 [Roseiarcus sp.]|nr:hypothetical protein [Roseiarcus sp.]
MMIHEIVATCSNPHVACAAVASIGGDFARRFSRDAADRNLSSGHLASRLVRNFAHNADGHDWDEVEEATRGVDMPILSGLRVILERSLEAHAEAPPAGWSIPNGARCDAAWRNCL